MTRTGTQAAFLRAQAALRAGTLAVVAGVLALVACTMLPAVLGWEPHVVLSNSMAPSILAGDVVLAAPHDPATTRPGQVLLFQQQGTGTRILHRAVSVSPDGTVVTRGDANAVDDSSSVPPSAILGLPRLRVPYVGLPVVWLRQDQIGHLAALGALVLMAALVLQPAGAARPAHRPAPRRA